MAPLRSLLVLLILIGLVSAATAVAQAPVQWYTEPGGGTVAGPAPDLQGGGAVAPLATGPGAASPAPGRKEAAEPKPSGATPASPSSRSRSGGATATAAAAAAGASARASGAHAAAAAAAQGEPADSQAGPIGALPFTGLELFVIVTAGLCLLLAGAVLRPRTARR
jgi:hypothetical protein